MDERIYWLGFSVFPGIGPGKFKKLLKYFKTASAAWVASPSELMNSGIGGIVAEQFDEYRNRFSLEDYAYILSKKDVGFCTLNDVSYPAHLANIKNPPIVLYYKGNLGFLEKAELNSIIAVVGSRKATSYGRQVTEFLVRDLTRAGCIIVSGLALGVDAIAHKTTITNKGKTVAVMGNGVDHCYPRENQAIYDSIIESGGVIVSEYSPGQLPSKGSFPSRNRIIAGLSCAVVVTEGTQDSGSLITAKDSWEQGRKVFAIPGPITSSYSKGPNLLISKGAIPVMNASDILKSLSIDAKSMQREFKAESQEEQMIIDFLQAKNAHINEIVKSLNMPVSKTNIILSLMEMKGIIKSTGTGVFALNTI